MKKAPVIYDEVGEWPVEEFNGTSVSGKSVTTFNLEEQWNPHPAQQKFMLAYPPLSLMFEERTNEPMNEELKRLEDKLDRILLLLADGNLREVLYSPTPREMQLIRDMGQHGGTMVFADIWGRLFKNRPQEEVVSFVAGAEARGFLRRVKKGVYALTLDGMAVFEGRARTAAGRVGEK